MVAMFQRFLKMLDREYECRNLNVVIWITLRFLFLNVGMNIYTVGISMWGISVYKILPTMQTYQQCKIYETEQNLPHNAKLTDNAKVTDNAKLNRVRNPTSMSKHQCRNLTVQKWMPMYGICRNLTVQKWMPMYGTSMGTSNECQCTEQCRNLTVQKWMPMYRTSMYQTSL